MLRRLSAAAREIAPKRLTAEGANPLQRFVGPALHGDGGQNAADNNECRHGVPLAAGFPLALAAGMFAGMTASAGFGPALNLAAIVATATTATHARDIGLRAASRHGQGDDAHGHDLGHDALAGPWRAADQGGADPAAAVMARPTIRSRPL